MLGENISLECSISDIDLKFLALNKPSSEKIKILAKRLALERTKYCRYPHLREGEINRATYKMLGKENEEQLLFLGGTQGVLVEKIERECEEQKLILVGEEQGLFNKFVPFAYMRYSVLQPESHKPVGFISPVGNENVRMKVVDYNEDLFLEAVASVTKWELEDYYPFNLYEGKGPIIHIHELDSGIYNSLAQQMIREAVQKEKAELVEILFFARSDLDSEFFWKEQLNFTIPPFEIGNYGEKKVAAWHSKIESP